MKLTKEDLKRMIVQELKVLVTGQSPMEEADEGEEIMQAIEDIPAATEKITSDMVPDIEKMAEPSGLDPAVLGSAVAAALKAKVDK